MSIAQANNQFSSVPAPTLADPFEADGPGDRGFLVGEKALQRLAIVSALAATAVPARRPDVDPLAWMLAPRRLFEGRTPLDACLEPRGFVRALAFLQDDTAALDAEAGSFRDIEDEETVEGARASALRTRRRAAAPALWIATLSAGSGSASVHALYAMVATTEGEVRDRLRGRIGAGADIADVSRGFDGADSLVLALLGEPVRDLLLQVGGDPDNPLSRGLDLCFEQRFDG